MNSQGQVAPAGKALAEWGEIAAGMAMGPYLQEGFGSAGG